MDRFVQNHTIISNLAAKYLIWTISHIKTELYSISPFGTIMNLGSSNIRPISHDLWAALHPLSMDTPNASHTQMSTFQHKTEWNMHMVGGKSRRSSHYIPCQTETSIAEMRREKERKRSNVKGGRRRRRRGEQQQRQLGQFQKQVPETEWKDEHLFGRWWILGARLQLFDFNCSLAITCSYRAHIWSLWSMSRSKR